MIYDKLVRDNEVHRRVYTDKDIFNRELTHLFQKSWILLGHECQVAQPGDFLLGRIGTRSVIIVRDMESTIQVFENRCMHRGASVCSERKGNRTRFTCPYHNWTYGTDGKLVGIPLADDYPDDFDKAQHGLTKVPDVAQYRGFIFASYDPPADLLNFLGSARRAFDDMMDRSPDGRLEALPGDLRYRVKANWKMVIENLNDSLHPMYAHASGFGAVRHLKDRTDINPITRLAASAPPPEMLQKPRSVATPYGHSFMEGLLALANIRAPRDEHFEALAARHGEEEAERILNGDIHVSLLYPSATINSRMQTIRLIRPVSVNETEVIAYAYRLAGVPEQVEKMAAEYVWTSSSPASFVVVDDFEIYERCQETYERGGEDWISVHRAAGRDKEADDGNLQGGGTSEGYIRNQYKVWRRYLEAGPA